MHKNASETSIIIIHQQIDHSRMDELDSLIQAQEIEKCLIGMGYSVHIVEICSLYILEDIIHTHPHSIFFNLVDSYNGKDKFAYLIPALLEANNMRFTGNTATSMQLVCQKNLMNSILRNANIPVPKIPTNTDTSNAWYIVKSVSEHASYGLSEANVLQGYNAAEKFKSKMKQELGGEWLIEEYIHGREFNISIIENIHHESIVLHPAEMVFHNYAPKQIAIIDYAAKWDEASFGYNNTKRVFIDTSLESVDYFLWKEIETICKQVWSVLGLKGYARIDFRVNESNKPFVIDVNPNPCINSDAGFIAASHQSGYNTTQILEQILASSQHAMSSPTKTP